MVVNSSQFLKFSINEDIEQIIFLNNMKFVNEVSLSSSIKYIAIDKDNNIHINGEIKFICKNRIAAYKIVKYIAESIDSDLFEDDTIEGYFEIIKNSDVSDFIIIGSLTEIEYAIVSNITMVRENDKGFNFGDIFKFTVNSKEIADYYVSEVYPRNLTKDSSCLNGDLSMTLFNEITISPPKVNVIDSELYVIKGIDGGTF